MLPFLLAYRVRIEPLQELRQPTAAGGSGLVTKQSHSAALLGRVEPKKDTIRCLFCVG